MTHKALASLLRRGAEKRPRQAFGEMIRDEFTSCAMGAILDGAEAVCNQEKRRIFDAVSRSALDSMHVCPGRNCLWREPNPVQSLIIHLNDEHRWSREMIADWLETLDVAAPAPKQTAIQVLAPAPRPEIVEPAAPAQTLVCSVPAPQAVEPPEQEYVASEVPVEEEEPEEVLV